MNRVSNFSIDLNEIGGACSFDIANGIKFAFRRNGEECQQLWMLDDSMSCYDFYRKISADKNTSTLVMSVCGIVVGIGRCTRQPKHIANGRIGYSILPEHRKKGYAPILIRLLEEYCCRAFELEPAEVTACVAENNTPSMKALCAAGFHATGNEYRWTGDRRAIEYAPTTK